MSDLQALFETLRGAALGGRVAHSPFLEPDDGDRLAARLRDAGAKVHVDGGAPAARRRVLTAYPEHVPRATTPLTAVYYPGARDEGALRAALRAAGVDPGTLGDALEHQDGLSLVLLAPAPEAALRPLHVGGAPVEPLEAGLERVAGGAPKRLQVVVPALRVDALGAKAFKVSRSFFAKGIAGGKVRVNGETAGKKTGVEAGDEVFAEGLGRMRIASVEGETKKGNLKVVLEVERL